MQACWKPENVNRALTNTANLAQSDNHYFLASHAPFRRIRNDRTKNDVTENEFFDALFRSSHRNVQAIIHGEPGSGKSHLIHWLKLRCEDEIETGGDLSDLRCVLIERRNGSLKDALQQMIDQLGEEYAPYLDKVRTALRQISSETARQELAGQLKLELGPRRNDRDLKPLPVDLKHFADCFVAPGFGEWLTRENGTIASVVGRLTSSSSVEDRQQVSEFQSKDFQPPPRYHLNNPPVVRELIDQFMDNDVLCEQAVGFANEALPNSVREMTGITAAELQTVFFDIRRDLARQKRRLGLFVEDVSVMSALDKELVVALEPQVREGLCDLYVVLGMTDSGLETIGSMPENQLQRVTHIFSVAQSQTQWGEDVDEMARFTARYLNTIRLSEERVKEVSASRRGGSDVTKSACDNCPFGASVSTECHDRFGYVELEDQTRIGLFPFTREMPRHWLHLFGTEGPAKFGRTPRALLMQLLLPALEHPTDIPQQFPSQSITLPPFTLSYWTSFEEQYCGGWPADERKRLQKLAIAWIDARDPSDAGRQLLPFVAAFGFPAFTQKVAQTKTAGKSEATSNTPPVSEPPKGPVVPPQLTQMLVAIEQWLSGKELSEDDEPRALLFEVVRKSIPWQDVTVIPAKERQFLLVGKGIIEIEGQRSHARGAVIRFPRNDETADLVRALGRFRFLGKNSWRFEDGERSKRTVAIWLRRHADDVINGLRPRGVDPEEAIKMAVAFLSISYMLGEHKKLPVEDLPKLAESIFQDFPPMPPKRFSQGGTDVVERIQKQHPDVRDMLAHELNVPQGLATSCNFIDPRRIFRAVRKITAEPEITRLSDDFHRDYWGHRYRCLRSIPVTTGLWEAERAALRDLRDAIDSMVQEDSETENPLEQYCKELADIREAQRQTKFVFPNVEFDPLWAARVYTQQVEAWTSELRRAEEVLNNTTIAAIATYAPNVLEEMKTAICAAENYLDELIENVKRNIEAATSEGDPDQLSPRLTTALQELVELKDKEKR
jgi:hypothetical protein